MEKFKICPVCHAKNSPTVLECVECGNDLMGVRIVDETNIDEETRSSNILDVEVIGEVLVRVCDCGFENELSARKCLACREDISDVIPTPRRKAEELPIYMLMSYDEAVKLELRCCSEHVLGREKELSEYLITKPFVSRCHAKITVTLDGLFIENLSKANGTYINNQKMVDGTAYKLCIGDEIGLGGNESINGRQEFAAYFVVRNK